MYLAIHVYKKQSVLTLMTPTDLKGIAEYLLECSDELEQMTGQRPDADVEGVIHRFYGCGWGTKTANGGEMVRLLDTIVGNLSPTIESLKADAMTQYRANIRRYPAHQKLEVKLSKLLKRVVER